MTDELKKDLLLAILSLDTYNRGYNSGLADGKNLDRNGRGKDGLGDAPGTLVGPFKIIYHSNNDPESNEVRSGFYALAYEAVEEADGFSKGDVVIAFRGTDNPSILDSASDIWRGWTIGAGYIGTSTQVDEAIRFYEAVTGRAYHEFAPGTILTGHSLGGGLAGFLSFLSGTSGVGFNHMPFGMAAVQ